MTSARSAALSADESEASGQLSLAVYTSFADLAAVREDWDAFVECSGSDIYFTFDWLETWWQYYGAGRTLRCFLVREADRIVAALPFFTERMGYGPLSVRIAKFVGADFTIPVFTPAIEPEAAEKALALALSDLIGAQHCDAVSLSPLSGACGLADVARALCANDPRLQIAYPAPAGVHISFTLPDRFDTYLKGLAKQTRSNYRRDTRNLAQDQKLTQQVMQGAAAACRFDRFITLHQQQWQAEQRLGHFGDWPDSGAFNRALVARLARSDRVRLHELHIDGTAIAAQYGFKLGSRYFWRLPARKVGEGWDRAGLGRVALVKMIEALIAEGIDRVEAGPGHYDYKVRHGGAEWPLHRLVVARASAASRARIAALLAVARLIDLAYYRIWFLKLAPRLGLKRRALWRLWIRTRL